MLVETKRRFLTRTLPGLVLAACTVERSLQAEQRIRLARSMQLASGETMIPMPDLGNGVDIVTAITSFGTERIEIHFRNKNLDGFVIPALAEGEVKAITDNPGPETLSRVKVKMKDKVWIFEAPGEPLDLKVGDQIKLGTPIFKLDFSRFREGFEGYKDPVMFIRATDGNDPMREKFSRIGRANILKNPNNTYVTIPTLQTGR